MGLGIGFSRDRYEEDLDTIRYRDRIKLPNPDPSNFTIVESLQVGKTLIVKIQYPDCTNYEGMKILLYENYNIYKLLSQKKIDPHFSDNKKYKSPLARFEPTEHGWNCAKKLAESMKGINV